MGCKIAHREYKRASHDKLELFLYSLIYLFIYLFIIICFFMPSLALASMVSVRHLIAAPQAAHTCKICLFILLISSSLFRTFYTFDFYIKYKNIHVIF